MGIIAVSYIAFLSLLNGLIEVAQEQPTSRSWIIGTALFLKLLP